MNGDTRIAKRFVLSSQTVARRLPTVLEKRGLDASAVKRWLLTTDRGEVWLFAEMDTRQMERIERYTRKDLVHHVSTVCNGIPVALSNTSGLRYCFLLSQRPTLPKSVDFPGCERGLVRLGIGTNGQPVSIRWADLGHCLVAGEVRMGKSNFLRLIIHQAIAEGSHLLLSDLSRTTFPMLAEHPALLAPLAGTPDGARTIVAQALAECDHRSALYSATLGFPEKLEEYNTIVSKIGGDPLPRLLVVLDEYNATITANGGHRGQFIQDVASLCWQAPKYGIHVIVAAQDFEKKIVGRMRDQTNAVCFLVQSRELARAVGCAGATRIDKSQKGRAITARWGALQTYRLDKSLLMASPAAPLAAVEQAMVLWAVQNKDGYLTLPDIQEHAGLGTYAARALGEDWERRGWLKKDTGNHNKRRITAKLMQLTGIQQTPQTSTDWPKNDRLTQTNDSLATD